MAINEEIDGVILGGSKAAPIWKLYIDQLFDIKHHPIGYKMVMNENHRFIITDTSFIKHPNAFQLKEIAKSAARIAKIFGWVPRVAMTSFATFGKPRLMNSKTVEDAINLMNKDESINFEYDGELNPEVSLNWRKLKEYEFCNLTDSANILVMPDKHSAGISVGLLKAVGNMDVIGSCV